MNIRIEPSTINGTINIIPSKSYAHRILIASSLTNKECYIHNIVKNNDILATINCLEALGKKVEWLDEQNIKISTILDFYNLPNKITLNCLESGSTMRFFIPIALLTGKEVTVKGTEKLISRGILPYELICQKQSIKVIKETNKITFMGKLKPDTFIMPGNISSQFITGLLFALPLLEGNSKIILENNLVSKNYVDITLDVLNKAGININTQTNEYLIEGFQQYNQTNYTVEGDYSNAAIIDAFNYLGQKVKIEGLNPNSFQGDKVYLDYFKKLKAGYGELDIDNCIDLGPILFAVAGLFHGAKFINTNRLKIKESNRILDVKEELIKFGIRVEEYDNYVIVSKQQIQRPKELLNGRNDHRIVMTLSVLACLYGGTITGIEAVNKSYPSFFQELEKLGMEAYFKC